MEKKKFIVAAAIEPVFNIVRVILIALFWIWGGSGFLLNLMAYTTLSNTIGVGQSAYMTANDLLWIGGMIFFGLGAAMIPAPYRFERPE